MTCREAPIFLPRKLAVISICDVLLFNLLAFEKALFAAHAFRVIQSDMRRRLAGQYVDFS